MKGNQQYRNNYDQQQKRGGYNKQNKGRKFNQYQDYEHHGYDHNKGFGHIEEVDETEKEGNRQYVMEDPDFEIKTSDAVRQNIVQEASNNQDLQKRPSHGML